ncbi:MAG: diacylglycerol kinase family lipid kinase [Candidatus Eisenbacteria bacterium]|jgi:YegS/Rv2252/BmrU family lipid kinase|nr:diacylglycerol kinase family lipid kinase [Candidatus Eisenbacteria bacterium]
MRGPFHHRVVVNPASGNGQGRRIGARLPAIFARLGLAAEFHHSTTAQHFRELIQGHAGDSGQRIVICGGDGSLNMALASMPPGERAVMALVPCGRGNDVARSLGIPARAEEAAGLLAEGIEREVDVGYVGEKPFASIAAMGFDALVSIAASRMRIVRGRLVYVIAALRQLARFVPPEFTIRSDTFNFQGRAMMVSLANAPYYGGGMMLSPSSSMEDGIMEICVVLPMSKLSLLRLLPRVFSGGHVDSPLFITSSARRATIATNTPVPVCADGEYLATSPVEVRIEQAAIRLVSPRTRPPKAES